MSAVCLLTAPGDQIITDRLAAALAASGVATIRCSTLDVTGTTVLAVWSRSSRADAGFIAAAAVARIEGRLIQIGWRHGTPPTEFAPEGYIDLSAWRGSRENPRFVTLLEAIRAISEGRPAPVGVGHRARRTRAARLFRVSAAGGSLALGLLGFLANIGGTRDFVCSIAAIGSTCRALGIDDSEASSDEADLRKLVDGKWGEPGCRRMGRFSFEHDELVQEWPAVGDRPAFHSRSTIEGNGKNVLFVRDNHAVKWTITVTGRHMTLKPEGGASETPLFKCD